MAIKLTELTEHDFSDDCPICRAQDVVQSALLPAAAAWESNSELPRFSVALHGAAALLGVMLQEGVERQEVDPRQTLQTACHNIRGPRRNSHIGGPH